MYESKWKYPNEYNEKTAVIVTAHGMGSNYDDLPPVATKIDSQAIQLNIQADLSFGEGYAFFVPDFREHSEQEVIQPVLVAVHDSIQEQLAEQQLTNHPLIFIGFSQGAMIGLGLTYLYPNWLDQVFLFSARMPAFYQSIAAQNLSNTTSKTAMFISQGITDPLFPRAIGESYAAYAKEKVATVAYHEYPIGHGIYQLAILDAKQFYQVNQMEKRKNK
jgi:predicted esterase